MANMDRPNGFRPAKSLIGAPWTALVREYPAAANRGGGATNDSGDIYIGDAVKLNAGNIEPVDAIADTVVGVVVGVGPKTTEQAQNTENATRYYNPDNLSKRYLPHDQDGYVGIVPAEACLFHVQSDATGMTQGATADIAITGTTARGSRTTGNSLQEITTGTTGTVTVVEHVKAPDNDPTLVDAKYLVKFINHANPIN